MNAYLTPVVGGLLLGLSALAMMLFSGRIAGISGIFWSAISSVKISSAKSSPEQAGGQWRWFFLAGLIIAPLITHAFSDIAQPAASTAGGSMAAAAGLLVGFGTVLGSGCTSGHGVCGIGRLSRRSIVSTALYMSVAAITVFITRHII